MPIPLLLAVSGFVLPTHVASPHRSSLALASPPATTLVKPPLCPLLLRGGSRSSAPVASSALAEGYKPERALQPTAFVFVLSVAIVALLPTTQLIGRLGATEATRLLSGISSVSALAEILLAPVVGALSDTIGRKPVLLIVLCSVMLVNLVAAAFPSIAMISVSRFVCNLVVGLFFLSAGATLGDAYRNEPGKLAAASGVLYALVNGGFAVGIALSRYLPNLQSGYAVSSLAAALACAYASFAVKETNPARVPFQLKAFNPVSCVRLLRHGREMQLLAVLLAVTLQPIFMGDVLQVFAIGEWKLRSEQVVTLFTLIPILGALGNVLGGRCVKLIGVQAFTAVATLSNMLFWAGCCISHRAALIGAAIGFLGPARTLGASTALTTVGASKGIPQGQLSGDRSNLVAILKVLGPAVYGQLYVRGKAFGLATMPFVFNLLLTFAALLLAPFALASTAEREADAKQK